MRRLTDDDEEDDDNTACSHFQTGHFFDVYYAWRKAAKSNLLRNTVVVHTKNLSSDVQQWW